MTIPLRRIAPIDQVVDSSPGGFGVSVFAEVGRFYRIDSAIFASRGDGHVARAAAAWQVRKLTAATLHKLSTPLRLGRPESVSNLTRRIDREIKKDLQLPADLQKIEARIVRNTKNKA